METTIDTLHWRLRALEENASAARLDRLEAEVARIAPPLSPQSWVDPNLTEPQVQYALADLCRSNATVFDVGANFGGLALTMSRAVGPRGAVCAFEANPLIATRCQINLNRWGCGNTQLYNNAIFDKSGGMLELYVSANMVSDSLYNKVSDRTVPVPGLALDDFIARTGLVPQLVKMDIEGAEYDALRGLERTLRRSTPIFILEQRPSEERCLALLQEHGYAAVDLRRYKPVAKMTDLPAGTEVTDLLLMPAAELEASPYSGRTQPEPVLQLGPEHFVWHADLHYATQQQIALPAGRYIVDVDFSASGPEEFKVGIGNRGRSIMGYHGTSTWLAQVARDWVFDLPYDAEVSVFFDYPAARDPSFQLQSVAISRMPGFPWAGLGPA